MKRHTTADFSSLDEEPAKGAWTCRGRWSGGLSLCDDSCEAVSGGTSVKDVLGHGDVFLGGRMVERSPTYQPTCCWLQIQHA
jgi:hypothetical protein